MTESQHRQSSRPTEEQKQAREDLARARDMQRERKLRTRRLIQVGGVMSAFGIETPEQAEQLMRTLVDPSREAWRRYLTDHLGVRETERW